MNDRVGCLLLSAALALGLFFMVAEISRGITWIRWAFS